MVPAFGRAAESARLFAVASRSQSKADEVAGNCGAERTYGSYEALLSDPDVEAVYLPLPNDQHAEWTLRALAAGKHVLCDKPAALNYADAERMANAAQDANLRLMEGFMCRHHPQHARVKEIIASGEIGEVVHFHGVFTYPSDNSAGGIRWQSQTNGGGAFWDVGVYPVNLARFFFGEPDAVFAAPVWDDETGADRHTSAVLEWTETGRTAQIVGGFDQAFASFYEITGSRGSVRAERAFQVGENGVTLTIRTSGANGKDEIRTEAFPHIDQWAEEIRHFSECVRDASKPLEPGENGLAQTRVTNALVRSGREKQRVEVG